jgi:hypothetical protein
MEHTETICITLEISARIIVCMWMHACRAETELVGAFRKMKHPHACEAFQKMKRPRACGYFIF